MAVTKEDVLMAISDVLDVDISELKEGKTLSDSVGVDSTEMVELNVALEKKFSVKLLKDEVTKDSKPEEIAELINTKIVAGENS